jgi:hypothetical protein
MRQRMVLAVVVVVVVEKIIIINFTEFGKILSIEKKSTCACVCEKEVAEKDGGTERRPTDSRDTAIDLRGEVVAASSYSSSLEGSSAATIIRVRNDTERVDF